MLLPILSAQEIHVVTHSRHFGHVFRETIFKGTIPGTWSKMGQQNPEFKKVYFVNSYVDDFLLEELF